MIGFMCFPSVESTMKLPLTRQDFRDCGHALREIDRNNHLQRQPPKAV
jgi:hypothetical protein